jgi:Protein of unknown function (DUF2958)
MWCLHPVLAPANTGRTASPSFWRAFNKSYGGTYQLSEYTGLFPDDVKATLPKLYAQEGNKDPTVYVKFFTPWSSWSWYATEGSEQDRDFIFFGYVIGQEREWGYFSLNELSSITGPFGLKIERDIHFQPKPKSQVSDIR